MELITKPIPEPLPISGYSAVVREIDGNAERLLWLKGTEDLGAALPDYWAYLTVKLGEVERPGRNDILALRAPDQEALPIGIYRCTVGDELVLTTPCARCGESANYTVDLSQLEMAPAQEGVTGPPDPTYEVVLPRTGHRVIWGFLTGHEERELMEVEGFDSTRRVWKSIRSINGKTGVKPAEVNNLPIMDIKTIRADMKARRCGYDPVVKFKHSCGYRMEVNLLMDPSFIAPGVPV
jgi:hypothetical protein